MTMPHTPIYKVGVAIGNDVHAELANNVSEVRCLLAT
jgi:hypothetical protein